MTLTGSDSWRSQSSDTFALNSSNDLSLLTFTFSVAHANSSMWNDIQTLTAVLFGILMQNHFGTVTLICFAEKLLQSNCRKKKTHLHMFYFWRISTRWLIQEGVIFWSWQGSPKQYLLMNNWRSPNGEMILSFFRCMHTFASWQEIVQEREKI